MGRQLNFFMFGDDEISFISYIRESRHRLMDKYGNILAIDSIINSPNGLDIYVVNRNISVFYIAADNSVVKLKKYGTIDYDTSEVI